MVEFPIKIPSFEEQIEFNVKEGQSIVFLGANGAGKTRLGAHIDKTLGRMSTHRIGAHRALNLNTKVATKNVETAFAELFYGISDPKRANQKELHRWGQKPYTFLLNDYDQLLAALFADESEQSTRFRQAHRKDPTTKSPESILDSVIAIWNRLLPHRQLDVGANDLKVQSLDDAGEPYDAGELSDGERVIFYMIGQCLLCPTGTLIIIDEPELHINKAILHLVYDEIEADRKDCAFIYITHDLDFAVSRQASKVFTVTACRFPDPRNPQNCQWQVTEVPENTGIEEEFIAAIVGSRQAIMFVEGTRGSLDTALYRWLFPEFTVLPARTCEAVIHSVVTFNSQEKLHRYTACGLIDYDHRSDDQIAWLRDRRISALPVSEAENLILLPDVLYQIALLMHFTPDEAKEKIDQIAAEVLALAKGSRDAAALRKAKRRLDERLKSVSAPAKDASAFAVEIRLLLANIDPDMMFEEIAAEIDKAIEDSDLEYLLREIDDKGLVAIAAKHLGFGKKGELEDFLGRVLRSPDGDGLAGVMRASLPEQVPTEFP